VKLNTKRYVQLIANAIDELLPEPDQQYQEEDVFDVMLHQRMQVMTLLTEPWNPFGNDLGPSSSPFGVGISSVPEYRNPKTPSTSSSYLKTKYSLLHRRRFTNPPKAMRTPQPLFRQTSADASRL
jgi:hypothetical protein